MSRDAVDGVATPVRFASLTDATERDLRALNAVLFPVRYGDAFYDACRRAGGCTQLAYAMDERGSGSATTTAMTLAGAIACRLEMNAASDGAKLYIMTLGVYAGRRDGKIGSRLLTHALNVASRDAFVKEAYLHVQTNNFQAFEFYERFGFEKGEVVKNYYKRIEPPDAVILRRDLGASWTERELEGVTFDEDAA
jgi:ribosomal protein S18 acetylase RimI-like enzyme|tara:strand:- start:6530 stop:7114 length:585 start_codon:yes stop_codon:yes gene_type:complete